MNNGFWKKGALLGAGIFLSHMTFTSATFSPTAQAQPDVNNAPKAENPTARERGNRPNRDNQNRGGNRGENQRNPEAGIRRMMEQAGINETATQDAILEYMKNDMEARRPLREHGMKVFRALRDGAVADDQLVALIADYRAAQQAEKTRREQTQAALDEKIKFSENPRLEAMLLLSGLIGDGDGLMMMPMGGGRGGRGDGMGGRGAGPGGRGGQEGGNPQQREERQKQMLERFDVNKDGKLDDAEEATMREQMRQRREQRGNRAPGAPAPANAMPGA